MALRTPAHNFSLAQKPVGVTSKRRQCSCRMCQMVYCRATAPSSNLGAAISLPQGGPAAAVGSRRARRPNFVVRRTSASCNLTVGSWECRQAAMGSTADTRWQLEELSLPSQLVIETLEPSIYAGVFQCRVSRGRVFNFLATVSSWA